MTKPLLNNGTLNIALPREWRKQLQRIADDKLINLSVAARQAIAQYINREGK